MGRSLLVISAWSNANLLALTMAGRSPRKDYIELARATGGAVLYRDDIQRHPALRAIARLLGMPMAQALLAFHRRADYDTVFTDAENIGLPLALLFKLMRTKRRHVMIGHRLTTRGKRPFFRFLHVQTHIDVIICHASRQRELIERDLHVPADRVVLLPYQVDEQFWAPLERPARRQICSAGLEYRDYGVLIEAVRGLDLDVVIAAASHWSKRRNEARRADLPPNVRVTALDYERLRDLYAESQFTVVPLHDVDFQAGITVILETMAMGKAVAVTRTLGQTDVIRDGDCQNGVYVPPGAAAALRAAIERLIAQPAYCAALGRQGRRDIEQQHTLRRYVQRIAALMDART